MKKSIFVLFVVLVLLMAAAVQADDLSDVTRNGVLRMGSSPEYVPFVFYDENDVMTGMDIALIQEVARRMGVTVQTVDIAFDGLIDSLQIGQVDIIGRGMSKTEAREELIDFSNVYYKAQAQFIALATLPKPASVDNSSFSNLKIGVQKATSFEQWIRDNLVSGGYVDLKNVYLFSNAMELMDGLDRGNVDLAILDQDVYELLFKPTGKYQMFYDGFLEEDYAFGLRKGSTLTDVISQHLSDMIKDGTAQDIANRFFSMDYSGDDSVITHPTVVPTAAPVIYPTQPAPAPVTCINSMTFVADVTVPDGYQVAPGDPFRKTWRVYNNGTCAWTPDYSFVYVSGDQMSGNNVFVPVSVAMGQTVDLSVDMIAPADLGTHKGYWQMRAPTGVNFGETVWVNVNVVNGPQPVYPTPTPEDGQHDMPITINSFYPDTYQGYPETCVTVYWSTDGAASAEIIVDGVSLYQWDGPNGSRTICNEVSGYGGHQIQLHALNVVTDAWASFNYSTLEHPTGLLTPVPDEHATGLIIP
ncbi:MAG: transporter substrate-binding domain-containing protein [Anaerolineaceae bacterium]|nr:transporter substrate-binding domain-containing protein [Anaerolineaceae bacterium]